MSMINKKILILEYVAFTIMKITYLLDYKINFLMNS